MLTAKLIAFELGCLLLYAGIKGRSVTALLKGSDAAAPSNPSVAAAPNG